MPRLLVAACVLTSWDSGGGKSRVLVGASDYAHTDFGDFGWCFGADDYYAGTASTAEVYYSRSHTRTYIHINPPCLGQTGSLCWHHSIIISFIRVHHTHAKPTLRPHTLCVTAKV